MRVVATVLAFDNPFGVREVIRCLARQTRQPDAVVVVDNASAEPVVVDASDAARLPGGVEVLRLDVNGGVGAGHNHAIRHALDHLEADAVWILEHDCFAEPTCLADLLAAHDGRGQVLVPYCARNRYERALAPVGGVVQASVFTFNATLIDRTVIEHVGAIREDFFVGQEDFDLSTRVRAAGFPIRQVNAATVLHAHRGSQRFDSYVSPGRLYYSARNLAAESLPTSPTGRLRTASLAVAKSIAEAIRPGRGMRYARARWWAHRDARRRRLGRSTRPL